MVAKILFVFLVAFSVLAFAAKTPTRPYITDVKSGFDRCEPNDLAGPCRGVRFVVKNPLPYAVAVEVSATVCPHGVNQEEDPDQCVTVDDSAVVPAHDAFGFDLGAGVGPADRDSLVLSWHKVKL